MNCESCGGMLETVKKTEFFIYFKCNDCKRGWCSMVKYINDSNINNKKYRLGLGEYDNDSRNDEVQTDSSEAEGKV